MMLGGRSGGADCATEAKPTNHIAATKRYTPKRPLCTGDPRPRGARPRNGKSVLILVDAFIHLAIAECR